jgi:hypothetical protein
MVKPICWTGPFLVHMGPCRTGIQHRLTLFHAIKTTKNYHFCFTLEALSPWLTLDDGFVCAGPPRSLHILPSNMHTATVPAPIPQRKLAESGNVSVGTTLEFKIWP